VLFFLFSCSRQSVSSREIWYALCQIMFTFFTICFLSSQCGKCGGMYEIIKFELCFCQWMTPCDRGTIVSIVPCRCTYCCPVFSAWKSNDIVHDIVLCHFAIASMRVRILSRALVWKGLCRPTSFTVCRPLPLVCSTSAPPRSNMVECRWHVGLKVSS